MATAIFIIIISVAFFTYAFKEKANYYQITRNWLRVFFDQHFASSLDQSMYISLRDSKYSENTLTPSIDKAHYNIPSDNKLLRKKSSMMTLSDDKDSINSGERSAKHASQTRQINYSIQQLIVLLKHFIPIASLLTAKKNLLRKDRIIILVNSFMVTPALCCLTYYYDN